MYFYDRHGSTENRFVFLYAQKVIGRFMEPIADILKDVEGRVGTPADNIGEVLGAAVTLLGGPLIAKVLGVANL